MPMLMGTRGDDILHWSESARLVSSLREKMSCRWERLGCAQTRSFLAEWQGSLQREIDYEVQAAERLDALYLQIGVAPDPGAVAELLACAREEAAAYYLRRRSVLALFEICGRIHDLAVERVLALAKASMQGKGQGEPPRYALLVSGERGRGETTLCFQNRYFLLQEEVDERFFLFRRHLSEALKEAGLVQGDASLWHGSLAQWETFADAAPSPATAAPLSIPPGIQWAEWLEALADLVFLNGESEMGETALEMARQALQRLRTGEKFQQLARQVLALPIGLGLFGRWRLQREGSHRGELDLDRLARFPLTALLRILALQAGISVPGSVQRIRELLESRGLDVELATRVLQSFQVVLQQRLEGEATLEEGQFCNPELWSEEEELRFRKALDAILHLQKIAYQKIFGQG